MVFGISCNPIFEEEVQVFVLLLGMKFWVCALVLHRLGWCFDCIPLLSIHKENCNKKWLVCRKTHVIICIREIEPWILHKSEYGVPDTESPYSFFGTAMCQICSVYMRRLRGQGAFTGLHKLPYTRTPVQVVGPHLQGWGWRSSDRVKWVSPYRLFFFVLSEGRMGRMESKRPPGVVYSLFRHWGWW